MSSLLNETFVSIFNDFRYSDYRTDRTVDIDQGILLLPVAGPPGTPPKIVRTHAPYMVKQDEWIAEKVNEKPVLPHWDTGNPGDVLLHAHWKPMSPLAGHGYFVFRCDGVYTYVSAVAPDKGSIKLPMGAPVNVKRTPEENTFTISSFDKTVLRNSADGALK